MINYIFGLPGSGKSTYLTYLARREINRINKGKSKYKRVLSNFAVKGTYLIDFNDLGVYDTSDSLILIDEATLCADSRDFKSFKKSSKQFILLHRHYHSDMWIASQQYDGVDKKIRDTTANMFYIKKLPFGISYMVRIPMHILVPEETGEIIQGYKMPKILERLFTSFGSHKFIYRPKYYKYFDSYDAPFLPVKEFEYCD